jgi:hypothetical protein
VAAKRSSNEIWTAMVVGWTTILLHGLLAVVAAFVLMPQETGFGLEYIRKETALTLMAMAVSSWVLGGTAIIYVKRVERIERK